MSILAMKMKLPRWSFEVATPSVFVFGIKLDQFYPFPSILPFILNTLLGTAATLHLCIHIDPNSSTLLQPSQLSPIETAKLVIITTQLYYMDYDRRLDTRCFFGA